jgi:hypothetical protein
MIDVLLVGTVQTGDGCSETLSFTNFDFSFETGTTGDEEEPSFASPPSASAENALQITATWPMATDNVGVTGYNVYRDTSSMGSTPDVGFKIASALSSATLTHTNSNTGDPLTESTTYFYIIGAFDAVGNEGFSSEVTTATDARELWGGSTGIWQELIISPSNFSSCINCHTGGSPAGGMNLSGSSGAAHTILVGVTSDGYPPDVRVVAFNSANSVFFHKLAGTGFSSQMPDDGPPFMNPTELERVEDWINEGALNN